MDAKLIVAFLFAAILSVYSKPVEDGLKELKDDDSIVLTHDEYEKITKIMDTLSKSVAKFKDDLMKKKAAEAATKATQEDFHSLEESLKEAVAEDNAKRSAKAPKSSFKNPDADFMDYDFDDYDALMEKRKAEPPTKNKKKPKDITKSESLAKRGDTAVSGLHLDQSDVEIVKPQVLDPNDGITNDNKENNARRGEATVSVQKLDQSADYEIVKPEVLDTPDGIATDEQKNAKRGDTALPGPHLDQLADTEIIKPEVLDPNDDSDQSDIAQVKHLAQDLKRYLKDVAADYKVMKANFEKIKNDSPMDDGTKEKFDGINADIKKVVAEIKQIKDEFGSEDLSDAVEEHDANALKDLLGDITAQVKDIKLDIKELVPGL